MFRAVASGVLTLGDIVHGVIPAACHPYICPAFVPTLLGFKFILWDVLGGHSRDPLMGTCQGQPVSYGAGVSQLGPATAWGARGHLHSSSKLQKIPGELCMGSFACSIMEKSSLTPPQMKGHRP